jgi:hypothetical protein
VKTSEADRHSALGERAGYRVRQLEFMASIAPVMLWVAIIAWTAVAASALIGLAAPRRPPARPV